MLIQKMFEPVLSRIPRNRSELVNDLEIPDVSLEPYIWVPVDTEELEDDELSDSSEELRIRALSDSTDSDMPLSRAMTDSDIDYDRYKLIKSRRLSDPFGQMREAMNHFPQSYLDSLSSFRATSSDVSTTSTLTDLEERVRYREELRRFNERQRRYSQELRLKMERFFNEDCTVFTPEDPGLLALEDALRSLDLTRLELELASELGI